MRVAVLFSRFGPYHVARVKAAAAALSAAGGELTGIQVAGADRTYAWQPVHPGAEYRSVTLFDNGLYDDLTAPQIGQRLRPALQEIGPDVLVLPGWSSPEALAALVWADGRGVPAVVMSESARLDAARAPWTEALKRSIVRCFDAALVGGSRHAAYLGELGMPGDRTFLGYDAVDNDYFASGAEEARARAPQLRREYRLPDRYFMASSRFVEKKNLPGLLMAFARYRGQAGADGWDLVLCGDGPSRDRLTEQANALGVRQAVHFPGFVQYDRLPVYYGLASAFIHASTVEQWGLVVNEAAAAGLPLLVSERCGCYPELLADGRNGFGFDPGDTQAMALLMQDIARAPERAAAMGQTSRQLVSAFGPARFAQGLVAAATAATATPRSRRAPVDRLVLRLLAMR